MDELLNRLSKNEADISVLNNEISHIVHNADKAEVRFNTLNTTLMVHIEKRETDRKEIDKKLNLHTIILVIVGLSSGSVALDTFKSLLPLMA